MLVQDEQYHLGMCELLGARLIQSWVARGAHEMETLRLVLWEEGATGNLSYLLYQGTSFCTSRTKVAK